MEEEIRNRLASRSISDEGLRDRLVRGYGQHGPRTLAPGQAALAYLALPGPERRWIARREAALKSTVAWAEAVICEEFIQAASASGSPLQAVLPVAEAVITEIAGASRTRGNDLAGRLGAASEAAAAAYLRLSDDGADRSRGGIVERTIGAAVNAVWSKVVQETDAVAEACSAWNEREVCAFRVDVRTDIAIVADDLLQALKGIRDGTLEILRRVERRDVDMALSAATAEVARPILPGVSFETGQELGKLVIGGTHRVPLNAAFLMRLVDDPVGALQELEDAARDAANEHAARLRLATALELLHGAEGRLEIAQGMLSLLSRRGDRLYGLAERSGDGAPTAPALPVPDMPIQLVAGEGLATLVGYAVVDDLRALEGDDATILGAATENPFANLEVAAALARPTGAEWPEPAAQGSNGHSSADVRQTAEVEA